MLLPILANQAEDAAPFETFDRADALRLQLGGEAVAIAGSMPSAVAVPIHLGERATLLVAVADTDDPVANIQDLPDEEQNVTLGIGIPTGEAIPSGLDENAILDVMLALTDLLPIQVLEPGAFEADRAGRDDGRLGLGEDAHAGILEHWNVPNTTADVNGRQLWTRVRGPAQQGIVGGRYRLLSATLAGGVAYAYARCDTPIGTPNYRVRLTVPRLLRNDSPDVSIGPIARKDTSGTHTFYQFRAQVAAVQNTFSLWKAVNGTFTQLGPTVPGTIQPNDVLELEVIGDGVTTTTLIAYWNGVAILGPIEDTAIPAGDFAGVMGYWESGVNAVVEGDDWAVEVLAAPVIPRAGQDAVPVRVAEALRALLNAFPAADVIPIGVGEFPEDTFFIKPGTEAAAVGIAEQAEILASLRVAEAVPVGLTAAELEFYIASGLGMPMGLSEAQSLAIENPTEKLSTDAAALQVVERDLLSVVAEPREVEAVAVGLAEQATPFILIAGPIGLVLVLDVTFTEAGPVEAVFQDAGPTEVLFEHGG